MATSQAFGYLSLPPATTQDQAYHARDVMVAQAATRGYEMTRLYVDVHGQSEQGFYELLEAVRRGETVAVVVPHLSHFTQHGCLSGADRRTVKRYLRCIIVELTADEVDVRSAPEPAWQTPAVADPGLPDDTFGRNLMTEAPQGDLVGAWRRPRH